MTRTSKRKPTGRRVLRQDTPKAALPDIAELVARLESSTVVDQFMSCLPPYGRSSDRLLNSVMLEKGRTSRLPRVLIDSGILRPEDFSLAGFKRDLQVIQEMVASKPEDFEKLIASVGDRDAFTAQATTMGLSERAFIEAGGGLLGPIVVFVLAMMLEGCSSGSSAPPVLPCVVTITMTNRIPPTGGPGAGSYTLDLDFTSSSTGLGHIVGWPSVANPLFSGTGSLKGQWKRLEELWNMGAIQAVSRGVNETFGNPCNVTVARNYGPDLGGISDLYFETRARCTTCGTPEHKWFPVTIP